MAIRRSKPKKIRKVITSLEDDQPAATDNPITLHTFTDPATTKRVIIDYTSGEDTGTQTDNDVIMVGLCLTSPGETLPTIGNIASEPNRWLAVWAGLAKEQGSDQHPYEIKSDLKIQRKVKNGDVLSLVSWQTKVGRQAGFATIFVDET